MSNETGLRKGFLTREAAIEYQCARSIDPPYCASQGPCAGDTYVRDPVHRAKGKVYAWAYPGIRKGGGERIYWGSYVGA